MSNELHEEGTPAAELAPPTERRPMLVLSLAPGCSEPSHGQKGYGSGGRRYREPAVEYAERLKRVADAELNLCRAEGVMAAIRRLPEHERDRLFALIEHNTDWAVRLSTAEQWVQENTDALIARITSQILDPEQTAAGDADMDAETAEWLDGLADKTLETVAAYLTKEFKAKRDRKPAPETVRRNVTICDLRRADKEKWSHGRLARKYGITDAAIRKVLKEEVRWRTIAAGLPENQQATSDPTPNQPVSTGNRLVGSDQSEN